MVFQIHFLFENIFKMWPYRLIQTHYLQIFDNSVGLVSRDEPDKLQGILSIHALEQQAYTSGRNIYTCEYDI